MKQKLRIYTALFLVFCILLANGTAYGAIIPRVTAVQTIPDKVVALGTTLANAKAQLPSKVKVTLSNRTTRSVIAIWDRGTPTYNGNTSGTYVFKSPVIVLGAIVPISFSTVSARIIVAKKVTSISTQAQISASYGASMESVIARLPSTVNVTLNNGVSQALPVIWQASSAWNSSQIGAINSFTGVLTLPADIKNPNNLKAMATIVITNGNEDPNPDSNLNASAGSTLFEFDSASDWMTSDSAVIQTDTTNYVSANGSTKLGAANPVNVSGTTNTYFSATTSQAVQDKLTGLQNMEFNMFIPDKKQIDYMVINFYTDESHNYFFQNAIGTWEMSPGWNKIRRPLSDFYFINSIPSVTTESNTAMASSVEQTNYAAAAKTVGSSKSAGMFDVSDEKAKLKAKVANFNDMLSAKNQAKDLKKTKTAKVKKTKVTDQSLEESSTVNEAVYSNIDVVTDAHATSVEALAVEEAVSSVDVKVAEEAASNTDSTITEEAVSNADAAATEEAVSNTDAAAAEETISSVDTEAVEEVVEAVAVPSSWASIDKVEFFVVSKEGSVPSINFDRIGYNLSGNAKVLFTFDDGWYDVKQYAEPILSAKGFNATVWANKEDAVYANELVSKGAMDIMSESDLAELYARGWDIGNHTVSHPDIISTLSVSELTAQYLDNQNWLLGNGFSRSALHACYPSGQYDASLIEILKGIGVKSARCVDYGIQPTPVSNIYKLKAVFISRDTSVSDIVNQIDKAAATGSSLFFMLHRVEETPIQTNDADGYNALAVSTEKFSQIVDYVSSLQQQGKIQVNTISQWYDQYMIP